MAIGTTRSTRAKHTQIDHLFPYEPLRFDELQIRKPLAVESAITRKQAISLRHGVRGDEKVWYQSVHLPPADLYACQVSPARQAAVRSQATNEAPSV